MFCSNNKLFNSYSLSSSLFTKFFSFPKLCFCFVFETINKNNKVLGNVMDKIKVIHLEIKECCSQFHNHTFKKQLHYLESKDNKVHKMNKNMVSMLSNLNTTMCHVFIKD
jgi:hypothetical protein